MDPNKRPETMQRITTPELAQAFGIVSIPTLVALRDGQVKEQLVGAYPKEAIREMLDRVAE